MNFNEYGYVHSAKASEEMRKARAEQIRKQDEERARNRRGWERLCDMLSPIGKREGE